MGETERYSDSSVSQNLSSENSRVGSSWKSFLNPSWDYDSSELDISSNRSSKGSLSWHYMNNEDCVSKGIPALTSFSDKTAPSEVLGVHGEINELRGQLQG